ncbi:MAG: transposase [Firmicutes bacterium]|nr:transposase [Bacillota bacterium]
MSNDKKIPLRSLTLITSPKLAEKATEIFLENEIPIHYTFNGQGTASSEMMDILGLGSPDKTILTCNLPKTFADKMLKRLNKSLKLGAVNSGIAYTQPISGANSLIVRMLEPLSEESERKEDIIMNEMKYALISVVVNQGYSEQVMTVARAAGARGGTVVHSRRVGNKETVGFWGLSIQEEKEMIYIVASVDSKLDIMKAIGEKFGMHSDAKGVVVSMPIDNVIGIE